MNAIEPAAIEFLRQVPSREGEPLAVEEDYRASGASIHTMNGTRRRRAQAGAPPEPEPDQ